MPLPADHSASGRSSLILPPGVRVILFFLYFLFSSLINAQDLKTFQYNTENGLPSGEVYDIEIDTNGLIWFTTDRGVCNYDGYEFQTYTTKDGLADNTNFQIFRDSRNRLWFTGFNNSLSIYENKKFRAFQANDSLRYELYSASGKYAANFQEDQSGDLVFTQAMIADFLYFRIDSCNELHVFNDEDWERKIIPGLPSSNALLLRNNTAYFISRIRAWPNGQRSTRALATNDFYFVSGKKTIYVINKETYQLLDSVNVNKTIEQMTLIDNRIWLSSSAGFFYYDLNSQQLSKTFMPNNYVTDVLMDREGNYWVSTVGDGLYRIPSPNFDYYLLDKNVENNDIVSIAALEHNIYFGNKKATILKIDKRGVYEEIYYNLDKNYQFNRVKKSRFKNKLVFTRGLTVFENGKDGLEVVTAPASNTLKGNISYTLNNGDIIFFEHVYFGVRDSLSNNYDLELDSKSYFSGPGKIQDIYQCTNDTIWLGTMEGLYKIVDYDYHQPIPVKVQGANPFGRINQMYRDTVGNLWISTIGNGLFCVRGSILMQWTMNAGLNSNMTNASLIVDKQLYIATNKGLNMAHLAYTPDSLPKIDFFYSITVDDGLSSNYINGLEYWDQRLWLATNEGLNAFRPEALDLSYPRIPVFIQSFSVGNESRNLDSLADLRHFEDDISISYAAVSFKRPQNKAFYRYRLIRNEKTANWLETNDKSIRFNDLNAGVYRFEIQARNKLDQWSEEPAVLHFEISPHFTGTPWFWSIAALYVTGLVFAGIRWRVRSVRKRSENEQKLSAAQLKARESELTLLRNQMNPHFIFNALNSIQNFIFKQEAEKANYFLTRFSSLIRKSLEFSKKSWISLEDELNYLRQYLEMESMRFPDKFSYSIEIQANLEKANLKVPTLLLQPVIENSVKHGFKNLEYQGRLLIDVRQVDSEVIQIDIEDNGTGMSEELVLERNRSSHPGGQQPHGLQIISDRLKLLREEMPDQEFSYETMKAQHSATGTRTVFLLPLMIK